MPPAAILDIDGTLVDTNYHHAIAWFRAFRQHDDGAADLAHPPAHRHGRRPARRALCGERRRGGEGRRHPRGREGALRGADRRGRAASTGARELIEELKERGHPVVLASSAKPDEVDHYLDLLDARELADDWTTSGDVEATKPEPDLVEAAMEKAGGGDAVMVGDSTWDCEAAGRAGHRDGRRAAPAASPRRSCATPARWPCSTRSTSCASALGETPLAAS